MNTLTLICVTVIQFFKQAWAAPQAITGAIQRKKMLAELEKREAERLDRIRNPSKYLGK